MSRKTKNILATVAVVLAHDLTLKPRLWLLGNPSLSGSGLYALLKEMGL